MAQAAEEAQDALLLGLVEMGVFTVGEVGAVVKEPALVVTGPMVVL